MKIFFLLTTEGGVYDNFLGKNGEGALIEAGAPNGANTVLNFIKISHLVEDLLARSYGYLSVCQNLSKYFQCFNPCPAEPGYTLHLQTV